VKPGSQIAFYNDSTKTWRAKFVTELFYRDQSVKVRLPRYETITLEEYNKIDYVLNMDEQRNLTILKRPGETFVVPPGLPEPVPE